MAELEKQIDEYIEKIQNDGFNCFSCFDCLRSKEHGFKSGIPDNEFFMQIGNAFKTGYEQCKKEISMIGETFQERKILNANIEYMAVQKENKILLEKNALLKMCCNCDHSTFTGTNQIYCNKTKSNHDYNGKCENWRIIENES